MAGRVVAGALAGAFLIPAAVYCLAAVWHVLKYGSLQEFWGIILALRAIPAGALVGGVLAFVLARRR